MATTTVAAQTRNGVKVQHLGPNNTLVRLAGPERYVLLPVQETNDDARIDVLKDGRLDKTLKVRLAKTKVDYYVPFDLSPYAGHEVMMNVVTTQDRSSVREVKQDVCWKNISLSDTFSTANTEKYRPLYHHTPLWGWMNDPNGMFYRDGVWHLYYQHNPLGSKWQNLSWGHSTSRDLIHWEAQPEALEPNGLGMVFSGSCALDRANTAGYGPDAVVGLYTSADASQVQSLVWSNDGGRSFEFYSANPVVTTESEARDPNMFWDEAHGRWVMLMAHALEHEMLIYTSPDMKEWTLQSAFGKGLGSQDGVWECPDLFQLEVEGEGIRKWMLICNINPGGPAGGSATQYFIGDFDGTTFTPDTDDQGHVPTKWMDYGKDHYATVSWSDAPDGRRTVIGWMSNWQYAAEVPTRQFRSANTLPRDLGLFRAGDGQIYVAANPSPEMKGLRDVLTSKAHNTTVSTSARTYALPTSNDGICEIVAEIDARSARTFDLVLRNKENESVVMTYNSETRTLAFDRNKSGLSDFSQFFPANTTAPTFEKDGKISLHIYVDRSSIELFGNDGRFVMTNLVFPSTPYTTLALQAHGGKACLDTLEVYSIKL